MTEADLLRLEDEARYARERHGLYRAKTYGPQATDASHLRDLERRLDLAEKRLHQARTVRENTEP